MNIAFTTIRLFKVTALCLLAVSFNLLANANETIESYLESRKINYLAELKQSISIIPPVQMSIYFDNAAPFQVKQVTLTQIETTLQSKTTACIIINCESLNPLNNEQLTTFVKQTFKAGSDLILQGTPSTDLEISLNQSNFLKVPSANPDLFIYKPQTQATANKHGFQLLDDEPMQTFAQLAAGRNSKALDIGGAYGSAVIHSLQQGATNVHAWEKSEVMASSLQTAVDQSDFKGYLTSKTIDFKTYQIIDEDRGSFDVILMSRVLHLFSPQEIEDSAHTLFDLLKPGGKLIISGETPLLKVTEKYIPIYLEKIENNEPWPGYMDRETLAIYLDPERVKKHSTGITFFDLKTPAKVFSQAGFTILINQHINRKGQHENSILLDDNSPFVEHRGKESIWLLLQKPVS